MAQAKTIHEFTDANGNTFKLLEGSSRRKYAFDKENEDHVYYFCVNGECCCVDLKTQRIGLLCVLDNIILPHERKKQLDLLFDEVVFPVVRRLRKNL